jgi:hypothetical protein
LRVRVLALIIGVAAFVPPAFASSGGPVVYTTYTERAALATVNADGTNSRVLVLGSDPAWSPSRRWIAFSVTWYSSHGLRTRSQSPPPARSK